MDSVLPALYILAAAGFILALKWMSSPATARRGVIAGEAGMLLAVIGTLLNDSGVVVAALALVVAVGAIVGSGVLNPALNPALPAAGERASADEGGIIGR